MLGLLAETAHQASWSYVDGGGEFDCIAYRMRSRRNSAIGLQQRFISLLIGGLGPGDTCGTLCEIHLGPGFDAAESECREIYIPTPSASQRRENARL
jgi:hypothetical protein